MGKSIEELAEGFEGIIPSQALKTVDRVTLGAHIYHQHHGENPEGAALSGAVILNTHEVEVYRSPKFKVGQDWKPLDTGWISREDVGWVLLENLEGTNLTQNPTEAEAQAIRSRVVLIRIGPPASPDSDDGWEALPGLWHLARVRAGSSPILVRCVEGQASCRVRVFPR